MKITEATQNILKRMKDTADPVHGAVFEKTVETDLGEFVDFIMSMFSNVAIEKINEYGKIVYLFFVGSKHIGSYIPGKKEGCFGGIRIGSQNPFLEPGNPPVKNPFDVITWGVQQ